MALKDITLGQYFPGNSLVHRLDPRTKLVAVVLFIVALFLGIPYLKSEHFSRQKAPQKTGGKSDA